jgi:hypothetical protein
MAGTTTHPLDQLIDSVRPIVTMERDGLVLIALATAAQPEGSDYLTLDEAADSDAVEVREMGSGSVPTVAVATKAQPVVIFGGDTIVGGKQNRIVNVTIWLPATTTTKIPVTCLEQGRWDPGTAARFASGPKADLRLRSMLNRQVQARARATAAFDDGLPSETRYAADQARVWEEVAMKQERAATTSHTNALHDLYASEDADVGTLRRAFPYPEGASGAVIGIGGRLVAMELYDRPSTARKLWPRLVESAVRGHLDHRRLVALGGAPVPTHRYPDGDALGRMLGRVKQAQVDALAAPAVGDGTDVRFETDRISGSALLREDRVVHVEVHRV